MIVRRITDTVDQFRKPEYTGENRCMPCTVVNAVIAVVLAFTAVGLFGSNIGWSVGLGMGAIVLGLAGGSIYFRGYLIPGTPTLTKTYFPDWVLRKFDKVPRTQAAVSADEDLDVETVLTRADVIEPCQTEDDLCLTEDFRAAWSDRIDVVRSEEASRSDLAEILGVEPNTLTFEEFGDAFVARVDGTRAGQWESRGAFLADVAAATLLEGCLSGWRALTLRQQSQILYGLRLFLEECPECTGTVAVREDTVESCCRSIDIVAVVCEECGTRMIEVDHPADGTQSVA